MAVSQNLIVLCFSPLTDQEKIGMKLMQQMGWKGSEGLGKKGQGRTTHVSVKMKKSMAGGFAVVRRLRAWALVLVPVPAQQLWIPMSGVGADEKTDYNWLATQDAFSDVLAGLSSAVASENGEGMFWIGYLMNI